MIVYPSVTIPETDSPDGSTLLMPSDIPEHIQPNPVFPPCARKGDLVFALLPMNLNYGYYLGYYANGVRSTWYAEVEDPIWGWREASSISFYEHNDYPDWHLDIEGFFGNSGFVVQPWYMYQRQTTTHIELGTIEHHNRPLTTFWERCGMNAKISAPYLGEEYPLTLGIEIKNQYEDWGIFYRRISENTDDDIVIMTPIFAALLFFGAAVCVNSAENITPNRTRRSQR